MDNMDSKTGNKNELFEQISDEYSMILLNWAHKKTGNRTEAEDLAQEVLAQIFRSARKEQHIEKLDNFIWKIAHFVWCNYLKKNVVLRECVPIDSFDYDFLSEKDHAEEYAEQEELNNKIKKMRSKISNLNYLQREIMIMHYIDELPIKSIAQKLNITEANVKWHLYDTRKKLKKEITEMNNTNYVYRPGKLHMAVSGNPGPAPATRKINESLTKQNICLACYREAKTSTEIAEQLGIAKAYIEFDLEWLVDKQFIKNENGRYLTMFSIKGQDMSAKTANIFLKNKDSFSDVIINKFIEKQDKIRNIRFYGCDQPMEKLLWFFIYRFINYAGNQVTYMEKKYQYPMERPIMPDGGQYFPLGFDKSEAQEVTEEFLNEKYNAIGSWDANGAMCNPNDDITLYWMGLYRAGTHTLEMLFESSNPSPNYNTFKFFCDTFKKDFNLNNINDDEKEILSKMIRNGWVSKKDDKIIYNFPVFTHEQNEALEKIFSEIYKEMKNEIYKIFADLEKLCRADLPKHLQYYTNYHLYMAFLYAIQLTTGFGVYDGKIYEPKDAIECGLLTFQVITKSEKPVRTEKITVNGKEYKALYFGEQDLTRFNWEAVKREFWRLENAYDDFKDREKTGDVLPYNNYPMAIETGQVFVIDYTNKDGFVKRKYYRSDGYIWQGMPSTEQFSIE